MKTLISICAAFILLSPLSALSQRRPDRFTIGQYSFEINLPSRPTDGESDHFKLAEFELHGEVIEWDLDDKRSATIGIYAPSKLGRLLVGPGRQNVIAAYADVVREDFRKKKLTISESPYTFSGSKGIEFRGTGDIRVVTRLFFVGVRLFAVTVFDESAGFDRQTKILDSFRLLTKAETIAALKWENDIEPVSQSRPVISLGNDIQTTGLKGNVCSVIDEVVISPSAAREIDRESYYDPSGNLMRQITYSRGYPQEITQWGWIDGKRISSTRTIFYLSPEVTPPDRFSVGFGPTTGMMGAQERDKIYGLRHEYSYDDKGRLTEHKAFTNERALKWTKKFTYSAAGREILTLDNTGGFLTRFFETFDKNGNIAEYKVLDMGGRPFGPAVRFVYEFDRGGNWIVRKAFPAGLPPAKTKPGPTTFRTITYCD
jgi:hypothetical protein